MSSREVQEIKSRLDVVDVIQEYTTLKQVGTNWKGLCPFHNEKTPSFVVSQDKQVWHCFGCGEGGDVFSFVEKIENVEFAECLRILARKANITLPEYNPEKANKRNALLEIHDAITKYYTQKLFSDVGVEAREYLKKRGLDKETVLAWKIGFASNTWDGAMGFLKSKGFSEELLLQSGIVTRGDQGRVYDRFRNRIMFPIFDHTGQVIGFSGRLLDSDTKAAKYINSPQTPIYDKSAVLFGLSHAKDAIRKEKTAVLVEGQMDVISSHRVGVQQVVASSGTALTQQQLQLLSRYSTELIVAYDQDSAGIKALERSIGLALSEGFTVRVAVLPEGSDPDDSIQKDPNQWKTIIAEPVEYIEYYFQKIQKTFDLASVQGKKQAAKTMLTIISQLRDSVEQDIHLQRLSGLLHVSTEALKQSLQKPTHAAQSQTQTTIKAPTPEQQLHARMQRLLACLMLKPDLVAFVQKVLPAEQWPHGQEQDLYKALVLFYDKNEHSTGENSPDTWFQQFELYIHNDQTDHLAVLAQALKLLSEDIAAQEIDTKREIEQLVIVLKRTLLQQQIERLQVQLAQQSTDSNEQTLEELNQLVRELGQLQKIANAHEA